MHPGSRTLLLAGLLLLAVVVVLAGYQAWVTGSDAFGTPDLVGTIETVADSLFGTWTIAFLSTVLLLTIAALGTIALALFGPTAVRQLPALHSPWVAGISFRPDRPQNRFAAH